MLSTFRRTPERTWLNIFKSTLDRQDWTAPFPVELLIDNSFTGQTTISPDGRYLVFVSNRGRDEGDTDLWMAVMQENGSWGSLSPLNSLNSPGHEITPFFLSQDTLFFASNGQGGQGGFDLFVSIRSSGSWQRPRALNSLNTEFDESDFIVLPNGRAIFASDRPGGQGGLDLYISIPEKTRPTQLVEVPRLDVKLEALVSNITISNDLAYQTYQMPYLINLDNLPIAGKEDLRFNQSTFIVEPDIDSVYNNSMDILKSRLADDNSARIFFRLPDAQPLMNEFRFYLASQLGLSDNRIVYNEKVLPEPPQNTAIIWADDSTLFEPFRAANHKLKTTPPVLQLHIQARPSEAVKAWNVFITTENFKPVGIARGSSGDTTIFIDMAQYAPILAKENECYTVLDVYDVSGNTFSDTLEFSINSMSLFSKQYYQINETNYQDYFVFACFKDFCGSLDRIIENIKLAVNNSDKVSIEYFSNDPRLSETAELISRKSGIPRNAIKKYDSSSASFDRILLPYVIRIRIYSDNYQ